MDSQRYAEGRLHGTRLELLRGVAGRRGYLQIISIDTRMRPRQGIICLAMIVAI
jgi:hypothetical protein